MFVIVVMQMISLAGHSARITVNIRSIYFAIAADGCPDGVAIDRAKKGIINADLGGDILLEQGWVMSKKKRYKSEAFAAIHETMDALHQIGCHRQKNHAGF